MFEIINFGIDFVAKQYYSIFKKVYREIETEMPNVSDFANLEIPNDCPKSWGFELLKVYQQQRI
jgi:hypothetical protein